jgi:hypothetical protein
VAVFAAPKHRDPQSERDFIVRCDEQHGARKQALPGSFDAVAFDDGPWGDGCDVTGF